MKKQENKKKVPVASRAVTRQRQAEVKKLLTDLIQKEYNDNEWSYKELMAAMKKDSPLPARLWFSGRHNFTMNTLIDFEMVFKIQLLSDDLTALKKKDPEMLKKSSLKTDPDFKKKTFWKQKTEAKKILSIKIEELLEKLSWRMTDVCKAIPGKNASQVFDWLNGKRSPTVNTLVDIELGLGLPLLVKPLSSARKSRISELRMFKRERMPQKRRTK